MSASSNLNSEEKKRYLEKISLIGRDPYDLREEESVNKDFPNVQWGDIVNYLVFKKSSYTLQNFKAFKSLEGYNQFICGWVKTINAMKIGEWYLVIGKVGKNYFLTVEIFFIFVSFERYF